MMVTWALSPFSGEWVDPKHTWPEILVNGLIRSTRQRLSLMAAVLKKLVSPTRIVHFVPAEQSRGEPVL